MLNCPQCKQPQADIRQAPDNFRREVFCYACGYSVPLKNYRRTMEKQKIYPRKTLFRFKNDIAKIKPAKTFEKYQGKSCGKLFRQKTKSLF